MTLTTTLLALALCRLPADVEVAAWATIRGVPVDLALAVADTETGNLPEARRDRVVSRGNYGRMQVSCSTWRRTFQIRDCRELLDRHANIRIGVTILAVYHARYGARAAEAFNAGHLGTRAGRRYQKEVESRMVLPLDSYEMIGQTTRVPRGVGSARSFGQQ